MDQDSPQPEAKSKYYSMDYKRRGMGLIFNQHTEPGNQSRLASEADLRKLEEMLKSLSFDVFIHDGFTLHEIQERLQQVAQMDHTDESMIWVVVLTRGDRNKMSGYDKVCEAFYHANCPTLVTKPKCFVLLKAWDPIEAPGGDANVRATNNEKKIEIPKEIFDDYMIESCGFDGEGYIERGSWYIQTLCKKMLEGNEISRTFVSLNLEYVLRFSSAEGLLYTWI